MMMPVLIRPHHNTTRYYSYLSLVLFVLSIAAIIEHTSSTLSNLQLGIKNKAVFKPLVQPGARSTWHVSRHLRRANVKRERHPIVGEVFQMRAKDTTTTSTTSTTRSGQKVITSASKLRSSEQQEDQQQESEVGNNQSLLGPKDHLCKDGRILRNPIKLSIAHSKSKKVRDYGGDGSLEKYMRLPVEQYSMLNESLITRNENNPDNFLLKVPRLTFFSVWIQPEVEVTVKTSHDRVVLKASNCHIEGSKAIMRMGLHRRFEFEADSMMRWISDGEEAQVIMDGSLSVWSEKLPPFNIMPTVVLQKGSNAVLGAAVKTIQRIFMNNLMGDYEKWATDPTYRAERAASKSAADAQKTVPV
mmetsp:Transcript_15194/g.18253  ORF Transcript_15194/g.18253 Transcript_15194/m.18253 type:complete len:358 (-) Transcript_15194:194-1267(-)|eukprot:jgi/Bigna1/85029/estExt_fgenesh1_pg.C_10632